MQEKAEAIGSIVASVKGAEDVSVGVSAGAMQLELALDRTAIARYGLNVADVREAVETGIGGSTAAEVVDGRRRFPVVVRLDATYRSTPEAVCRTLIRTPAGGTVTLSQLARVTVVEGPEVINHDAGQRYVVLQSNVRGRHLGSFVAEVRKQVTEQVTLPSGYYVTYGGQFENQARATCATSGGLFSSGPRPPEVAGIWIDSIKTTATDTLAWVLAPAGDDGTLHVSVRPDADGSLRSHSEEVSYGTWYASGTSPDAEGRQLCFKPRARFAATCYHFRLDTITTAKVRRRLTVLGYRGRHRTSDRVLLERTP